MNEHEQEQARRLGRAWDALVSGAEARDIPPDLLAEIRFAQEVLAVPDAAPATRDVIWRQVSGRDLPAAVSTASVVASSNGMATTHNLAPTAAFAPRRRGAWLAAWRIIAIGAVAGFAAGFLAGIWTRIAMRVSGFLTIDRNRYLLTENDARVGDITLGGTLFLGFFVAAIGILGGLLYVSIRRWLPRSLPLRAVTYGALLLAVFGFILMDENNPDYQLFGPAWVNVFTFSLTYVVFGVLASLFAEWLDVHVAPFRLGHGASWRGRLSTLVLAPFGLLVLLLFPPILTIGGNASAVMLLGWLGVAGLLLLVARTRPWEWLQSPVVYRIGLTAALVPALFGVYLTAQGVVGILTG
jgi:hypothetical protein